MQTEIIYFLNNNARNSYFYYLHRNNGAILERKEYLLNMLLLFILEIDITYTLLNINVQLFTEIEKILNQKLEVQEKINLLKQYLFMKDLKTYNEVIKLISFSLDPMLYECISTNVTKRNDKNISLLIKNINNCRIILKDELESLNSTLTRRRNIS